MSNNGRLTEAQQLLLQKFPQLPDDDPLVELAAWNASLEQKVDDFGSRLDVWTNAILKQTDLATQQNQLIVSQNLTLQETSKTNAALGLTLIQLKQGLTQLQTEFKSLTNTISLHGTALSSLNTQSQSLGKKLDDLSLKLKSLETLKSPDKKVDTLTENLNSNRLLVIIFGVLILGIQVMQLFAYKGLSENLQSAIQGVRERTEWALVKLERLEKR